MKKKSTIGIIMIILFSGLFGAINFSTKNSMAGTVKSGLIIINETWTQLGSPYWIVGNITIANGATLTIDPGVQVKFNGFYSLYIDGTLYATGENVNKIDITSNMTSPLPGDWNRIQINSTGFADIKFCDIKYGIYGVYLGLTSNNIIANNTITSHNESGIFLGTSSYNIITNNSIIFNNNTGINMVGSSWNNISNNNISANTWVGLRAESFSNNNTLFNNTIFDNVNGIHLYSSSTGNIIMNNNISKNTIGIYLGASSRENKITNNSISLNNKNGIELYLNSNDNKIIGNNISSNNENGIIISSSSYNIIYHNKIINNINQAEDDTDNNFWNDSYPSGGNYWSDHSPTCVDNFFGSITPQTTGSPDGICDIQRDIDSDSIDYYPLKNPAGVDTTPPVITDPQPLPESIRNDNSPMISANYSDMSGIDVGSVVLKVDNIIVLATIEINNVTYTPATPLSEGIHNITLEVRDASFNHNLAVVTWNFTIDTIPPTANAGEDRQIVVGETIIFNGSASSDEGGIISNYTWSFYYNGKIITLYGVNPEFRFEKVGNYDVTLKVVDSAGNYATDTLRVAVVQNELSFNVMWWILLVCIIIILMILIVLAMVRRKNSKEDKNAIEDELKKEERRRYQ